jgi:S1-C subfamily serine protease
MTAEDKIVITAEDVAEPETAAPSQLSAEPILPLWWRILSMLLVLFPPLLFAVTIGDLVKVRRRNLPVRHAHALHYCCLLLASGVLWTILLLGLALWRPAGLLGQATRSDAVSLESFPALPSTSALSGRDIAQQLSPLVVVVHPAERPLFPQHGGIWQASGAGVIALAAHDGCLALTSRHVVDALVGSSSIGKRVGVSMRDGQHTEASVVGLHRSLDLALLWIPREASQAVFAQPIRRFKAVEVGEQVFVIGHPEGLDFSLSGGLVAQTRGEDLIQVSAPVSPGNSGGPVYDTHGRLLAIVQSVFDKSKNPNAENLNFAVRVDDLFAADAWTLLKDGRLALAAFAASEKGEAQ